MPEGRTEPTDHIQCKKSRTARVMSVSNFSVLTVVKFSVANLNLFCLIYKLQIIHKRDSAQPNTNLLAHENNKRKTIHYTILNIF